MLNLRTSILILSLLAAAYPVLAQTAPGDSALPFSLPDSNGQMISMDHFKGEILVINVFTTWCVPCQIEAPQLEAAIWQEYRDEDVTVLGINFQEDFRKISDFAREYGLSYPLVLDTAGVVFFGYELRSFPSNIIINREGTIAWFEEGFNIEEMAGVIDSLLAVTAIGNAQSIHNKPGAIQLLGNYPNPFNPSTSIHFTAAGTGTVTFKIYNQLGQRISQFEHSAQQGFNSVTVGLNSQPTGQYFYTAEHAGTIDSGTFILQK